MTVNKVAAAYLAYIAYTDDALEVVKAADFQDMLSQVPSGDANGPWALTWGPAVNVGILAYVAQGADGSYALAFRGTDSDATVPAFWENVLTDAEYGAVPWLYGSPQDPQFRVTSGTMQALTLAMAMSDPKHDQLLLDYLRSIATASAPKLIVTGHSLGGGIVPAAAAFLHDQVGKLGGGTFTILPCTFAAPTISTAPFSTWFEQNFDHYTAVNRQDIVPKAWNNLAGVKDLFTPPGPSASWEIKAAIDAVLPLVPQYGSITPNDLFTRTPLATGDWFTEAGDMHSMADTYFPHATGGKTAPPLPNTKTGGRAMTRAAARERQLDRAVRRESRGGASRGARPALPSLPGR